MPFLLSSDSLNTKSLPLSHKQIIKLILFLHLQAGQKDQAISEKDQAISEKSQLITQLCSAIEKCQETVSEGFRKSLHFQRDHIIIGQSCSFDALGLLPVTANSMFCSKCLAREAILLLK